MAPYSSHKHRPLIKHAKGNFVQKEALKQLLTLLFVRFSVDLVFAEWSGFSVGLPLLLISCRNFHREISVAAAAVRMRPMDSLSLSDSGRAQVQ